ncbi:MAG TPA: DUF6456 domain-containing protein [Rhizomicrobium sp.]|jgi:hypothetical protein|nr:DUF6456 domain-containing protein [Rhizomicrobium sp.]
MIAERELQREARRVLRKLEDRDAALIRLDDGRYALMQDGKPDRARTRVAAKTVAAFRARDWIAPRGTAPESFVLSGAGAAWLRRAMADGDPYAAQHRQIVKQLVRDADGIERLVDVNEAESPLAWLRSRGLIDAVQWAAGERLRRDFTVAQLAPRLGVDLAAPIVAGKRGASAALNLTETVLAAKQRFSRAMKSVGPVLNDLLFDVCCHLIGLEDAEANKGWPQRTGKVVLVIALDRLAAHYGMIVDAPSHAPMRSWQME